MELDTSSTRIVAVLSIAVLAVAAVSLPAQEKPSIAVAPSKMPKLATVDPRFVSYNVEMVEVTGGRFWKPYKSPAVVPVPSPQASQQVGIDPTRFQYRSPIDLSNPRLRKLAAALGPSYVRVSGSWANSTYFQDDDKPALADPPKGFRGVLTRAEWKGVIDFAHAVDDQVVTSFAISSGTRDADGVWTPVQAKALLDYTKSIGGNIPATEFMNEPTFPGPGGAPSGYNAATYVKDAKLFEAFLRKESPQTIYLGPGSVGGVGEGAPSKRSGGAGVGMGLIGTEDILNGTGALFDAFSYHFYGSISRRCGGNTTASSALTAEWLDFSANVADYYRKLRDQYLSGKPLWLTETAEAACGGDPLAGQFVDTFRYLNQLGTLAQRGVKSVMHNTLASSDYGLLDEDTLEPRPDYWAALLWKRTMGNVVLDPGVPENQNLRIYAHCSSSRKGGVSLVVLNTDTEHENILTLPSSVEKFSLTAPDLTSATVLLNGTALNAEPDGSVRPLTADKVRSGPVRLPPSSVSFLIISAAHNRSCM
jgi:heparanase 1